eukprot:CAMPEP_0119397332 /NCGR_PEP_ID=MMETSP1334-20130426/140279_1 /TAXON_ID=127549 /ORGANISM="Calcidiscus leptoporus, Strain RCC1130" /LENGTH=493 /DNA_ID=CAMNT_0007421171 /DNA_START=63 /DNA_END=1545 /DNA_ORIENTATION=+
MDKWLEYESKMKAEGLNDEAIAAFKYTFTKLTSGESLMIGEAAIKPVASLPQYESLTKEDASLLTQTVMLKLNGGLGTGMGLEKAKSLLEIKDGNTFLDFIAKQVEQMRVAFKSTLAFMLMNSFSTSDDTLAFLSKYPNLATSDLPLEFVQNKAPKVTASDFSPVSWSSNPSHEWCPPGHGDLYPAMRGSGSLQMLLDKGYKYMFVSNSDNLGATMDLKLLTWFAKSKAPFAMEVAARTDADKKGGHLAVSKKTGSLLLREAAQCPPEDEKEFQNVDKYKFFNTNNLWIDLPALAAAFKHYGTLPLPVISNSKTVDPRDKKSTKVLQLETAMGSAIECFSGAQAILIRPADKKSTKVLQLETAMGSAIECFDGAQAILIPRTRFAPVKTTNDMLALMSDAYEVTPDHRMILKAERNGVPPNVKLDGCYKFVDDLLKMVPNGPPSLIDCTKLTIEGKVSLAAGVVFKGTVKVVNAADEVKEVAAGTYTDTSIEL